MADGIGGKRGPKKDVAVSCYRHDVKAFRMADLTRRLDRIAHRCKKYVSAHKIRQLRTSRSIQRHVSINPIAECSLD